MNQKKDKFDKELFIQELTKNKEIKEVKDYNIEVIQVIPKTDNNLTICISYRNPNKLIMYLVNNKLEPIINTDIGYNGYPILKYSVHEVHDEIQRMISKNNNINKIS